MLTSSSVMRMENLYQQGVVIAVVHDNESLHLPRLPTEKTREAREMTMGAYFAFLQTPLAVINDHE